MTAKDLVLSSRSDIIGNVFDGEWDEDVLETDDDVLMGAWSEVVWTIEQLNIEFRHLEKLLGQAALQ